MQSCLRSLHCLLLLLLAVSSLNTQPHVDTAKRYVGITETHGNNRSPVIDRWNRAVGVPLGSPYCASAVSAWLTSAHAQLPRMRSARARGFISVRAIEANRVLRGECTVEAGDIIIWQRAGGGHIGIAAERWSGSHGKVIEANTSSGKRGSQWNGDGIWIRERRITPLTAFRITHIVKVSY